jgi:hypothetical protein
MIRPTYLIPTAHVINPLTKQQGNRYYTGANFLVTLVNCALIYVCDKPDQIVTGIRRI